MRKDLFLVKRALLSLFALVVIAMEARAQYVFVIGKPANGGEIRVGKSLDLGAYMDGSAFIDNAQLGETVYFDFRPYTDWQFTEITYDENLSAADVTESAGIYSFTYHH